MCCSKQSGQGKPQKRLVSHKNIWEYSILGRGNSKYKDEKVGSSSAFQAKTRPCALRGEQGRERGNVKRQPGARTCVAFKTIIRTLNFIFSEVRSHLRVLNIRMK